MAKTKDALQTLADQSKAEGAIRHAVHDYTILLWCRWSVQQKDNVFEPIVRSHLAFSYLLPYRAFADFFSTRRYFPDDLTKGDIDIHAVDYSDHVSYDRTQWNAWQPHMNTHLFHINYFRARSVTTFDSESVINSLHPEFEANWKNFIGRLRGDFPRIFKEHMDGKRKEFPKLILYP
jgi:hypothetical protein